MFWRDKKEMVRLVHEIKKAHDKMVSVAEDKLDRLSESIDGLEQRIYDLEKMMATGSEPRLTATEVSMAEEFSERQQRFHKNIEVLLKEIDTLQEISSDGKNASSLTTNMRLMIDAVVRSGEKVKGHIDAWL